MTTSPELKSLEVGLVGRYDPRAPNKQFEHLLTELDAAEDSTDDAVKHVYASAGAAVYYAQCFEAGLQLCLLLEAKCRGTTQTVAEHDLLKEALSSKTCGALLTEVRKRVQINAEAERVIDLALQTRNRLIHGFFWDHSENMLHRAGRRVIVAELAEMARLFTFADLVTEAAVKTLLKVLGVTDEQVESQMNAMKKRVNSDL